MAGEAPRRSGKALSVMASPCRLSRRENRSVSKKPRRVCRPQAALGAELCDLYAKSVQIVGAADCDPFWTVSAKGAAALSQFHATEIFPRIRTLQVLPHFQTYHAAMAFL